ncbi:hypothetical protein [Rubripirellula lacrimiformis]|uniref:hypothetical protein n=1 Tax=Rubripirellula lacrimiformis TaxID=1930273 RepID=UPI0011A2BE1F|nr:hypothetical protein [Rubripirellula lacrimiformis]
MSTIEHAIHPGRVLSDLKPLHFDPESVETDALQFPSTVLPSIGHRSDISVRLKSMCSSKAIGRGVI